VALFATATVFNGVVRPTGITKLICMLSLPTE
jgi:hypothetical protein